MIESASMSRLATLVALLAIALVPTAIAEVPEPIPLAELPDGKELCERINARKRADFATRDAKLELIDGDSQVRHRNMRSFWKRYPDAKKIFLYAVDPPKVRHQSFLAVDYYDGREDDQWLYTPDRKQAYRVAMRNRGQDFLGSEFSLEDIKKEDHLDCAGFQWKTLGQEQLSGRDVYLLEQKPETSDLATELGFGRAVNYVDKKSLGRSKIRIFDLDNEPLKTFEVKAAQEIDGFWTATKIEATNHRTGARSIMSFENIDFKTPIDDGFFHIRTMRHEFVR